MIGSEILFGENLKDEDVAIAVLHNCLSSNADIHAKINECRNIHKGIKSQDVLDRITRPLVKKVQDGCGEVTLEKYALAAEMRHIPIVSSYLKLLQAEELDRPLVVEAYTTDSESAFEREDMILKAMNDTEYQRVLNKIKAIQLQSSIIQLQNQINEAEQGQQMSEEEAMQMQMNKVQMKAQMDYLNSIIIQETSLNEKELESVKGYYYYNYKTSQERLGELVCSFLINDQNLRMTFNKALEDRMVTGMGILCSDWIHGMKDPFITRVKPENMYFPKNESVDFLHQHQYCVEEMNLTYDNICARFFNYITPEVRNKLKNEMGRTTTVNLNQQAFLPDGTFVGTDGHNASSSMTDLGFKVYKIFWKKDEAINVLYKKNEKSKSNQDFIKILSKEEADKIASNPSKMNSRGERIEKRYIQRLKYAILVGKDTFLYAGDYPTQLRSETDKTCVDLPYFDFSIENSGDLQSLIWDTKDLSEMFDILFYQRELLWLLAGVRGIVYDLSQIPDEMEFEDVIFYSRQGILPIQSVDENGKARQFNQFQTYDQTVSPSIQFVEGSLNSLLELIGRVMGVTDPRLGIQKPTDQVGTSMLSYNQSSLTTEWYIQKHEKIVEFALARAANLSKIAYKDGADRGILVAGDAVKRVLIPAGKMKGEYKIMIKSGRKVSKKMEDYKGAIKAQFVRNQIPASLFLETLTVDSFTELRRIIKQHEDLQSKIQQQNIEGQQAHEKEIEQMKAEATMRYKQFEGELKMKTEQLNAQIKSQIEMQKIQASKEKLAIESGLWKEDVESRERSNKYAVDKDFSIEMAYLKEQQRNTDIQNQNNKISMLLSSIDTQLKLGAKKEKIKD